MDTATSEPFVEHVNATVQDIDRAARFITTALPEWRVRGGGTLVTNSGLLGSSTSTGPIFTIGGKGDGSGSSAGSISSSITPASCRPRYRWRTRQSRRSTPCSDC